MHLRTKHFAWLAVLIFVISTLSSCKKDSNLSPANMGYRYFPVQTGHWVSYAVDSISWDDFTGNVDTFHFQIKEQFESQFYDDQNRLCVRIERYKRESDTSEWDLKDIWYACQTASTVEKTEENVRYVKLIFPIEEGGSWNGNAQNIMDAQDYEYTDAHVFRQLGGFSFDSTSRVLQRDEATQISKNLEEEIFATGIGMIYKRYINLEKFPTGQINKGTDYSYVVTGWGEQ
jgi:hypothetical protein